jgi:hypothetical protein
VLVVAGVELVVAVVCVVLCGLALWCLAGFLAVVAVVGVVGVVAVVCALGVVVDEDAPQPAATRASDAAVTHRTVSRLVLILA